MNGQYIKEEAVVAVEIWPNSYKPIIIMQNVTNDSRSHSYRLIVIYLDNKTARERQWTCMQQTECGRHGPFREDREKEMDISRQ
jgi:hypothetical protein